MLALSRILKGRNSAFYLRLSTDCKDPCEPPHPCDAPCGNKLEGLVIGAYETCDGFKLTSTAKAFDEEMNGAVSAAIKGARIKLGKASLLTGLGCPPFHSVAVAGLGDECAQMSQEQNLDEKKENIRIAAAAGTLALEKIGVTQIHVEDFCDGQSSAEGAALAIWKYQELLNKKKRKMMTCICPYKCTDKCGWKKGLTLACGQNTARLLEEVPPNIMTPFNFTQYAIDILCPLGVSVIVRDLKWIEKQKMSAFLKVAQGSCEKPYLLELHYCGGPEGNAPIGLVGQGTTFNSGGICLKTCKEMRHMGADMAGGAVIVGTFQAAATLKTPHNLSALIPLYENMPGGLALKPGDVVYSLKGKTVRVQNTSKDARVVLADMMAYMCNFGSSRLVNIGSLSHKAMLEALGTSSAALFTNCDDVASDFVCAGANTGDRVWRMPLWTTFKKKLTKFLCCDVNNEAGRPGGDSCVGAAFLTQFLPKNVKKFAHLDISGVGLLSNGYGEPYLEPSSMSGRPTRTIVQYLCCLPPTKGPCP